MIGIVDSGSTKTDWCLVDHSGEKRVRTAGINPYFQSEEEMAETLQTQLLPAMEAIYFYGAGCATETVNQKVEQAIRRFFPVAVEVQSDLIAAARALCGHEAGIACILGTGANSCAFDGERIVEQVSPLGYVLGDEGSGAVLGKRLVGDVLKHQLSPVVEQLFFGETELTAAAILDKVYRQPFPNRFLASLVPFVKRHIDEPSLRLLVEDNFRTFFVRNVNAHGPDHAVAYGGLDSLSFIVKQNKTDIDYGISEDNRAGVSL